MFSRFIIKIHNLASYVCTESSSGGEMRDPILSVLAAIDAVSRGSSFDKNMLKRFGGEFSEFGFP